MYYPANVHEQWLWSLEENNNNPDGAKYPISWLQSDHLAMLHLSHRLGLDELIPAALYDCAGNASVPQLFACMSITTQDKRLHELSIEEVKRCFEARDNVWEAKLGLFDEWSYQSAVDPACTQPDVCRKSIDAMIADVHAGGTLRDHDVFTPLDSIIDEYRRLGTCETCASHLKAINRQDREQLWAKLHWDYVSESVSSTLLASYNMLLTCESRPTAIWMSLLNPGVQTIAVTNIEASVPM